MIGHPPTPDPFHDIRVLALSTIHGTNYWVRRSVTRMDIDIGPYEHISSAHVDGVTDQLVTFLPGLVEHRCSVGRRGGFIERLRDGTYPGHIIEHVALELQGMIGHDAGFGRTRDTGTDNHYTVIIAHAYELVGLRAAMLALDVVQRAFAGTLTTQSSDPGGAQLRSRTLDELRAVAAVTVPPRGERHVVCAVTGGQGRALFADAIDAADVSPSYILHAGLPYTSSDVAVVLDAALVDVPARFREPERAAKLVTVVADAVVEGGAVLCPDHLTLVHERIRSAGRRVVTFAPSEDLDTHLNSALACYATWRAAARSMLHGAP